MNDSVSRFSVWIGVTAVVVAAVHALPLLLNYARHGDLLPAVYRDEEVYLVRIVDAYRGGSLGNPCLAEHQDAPRYLPELAERTVAGAARGIGMAPLPATAATRVLFPALI